jgi:hypothetical protein
MPSSPGALRGSALSGTELREAPAWAIGLSAANADGWPRFAVSCHCRAVTTHPDPIASSLRRVIQVHTVFRDPETVARLLACEAHPDLCGRRPRGPHFWLSPRGAAHRQGAVRGFGRDRVRGTHDDIADECSSGGGLHRVCQSCRPAGHGRFISGVLAGRTKNSGRRGLPDPSARNDVSELQPRRRRPKPHGPRCIPSGDPSQSV